MSQIVMKIRGLIAAVVVFFILSGILYWSEHHKPGEETAKTAADTPPVILKLNQSAITKLELRRKGTDPVVLAKADSGEWQITAPQSLRADQSAVSGMVSTLSSLNSERLVEDKAADLKLYALDQPALEVDITEKGNKTQKLFAGDETPASGAVYVMLAGDPRVFTISKYVKTSVDQSLNDVRDKRLLTVSADKVSRVELVSSSKHEDIEFGRHQDKWQMVKPKPSRADSVQVGELVRKLTDARMDLSSYDAKEAASVFAHATPLAIAKVTDESGTQELQVRRAQAGKPEETYYAKSSAVDGIYKINSDLGQALDKGVDDFRNKKLFDFGFVEPNKVELHIGSKGYFLSRSGEDWWQDGKKMDAATVQSLISKLRDFTADKFLDSGFANPTIDVSVTSDEGKRVEKVLMAKSTDGYVAKRENDPALYRLNSRSVDDLQRAADRAEPAAATSK
jgi:hypothetical protein